MRPPFTVGDDLLHRLVVVAIDSLDRFNDQLPRLLLAEGGKLHFVEKVVPGAFRPVPLLADLHAGNHRAQVLGKILHEHAAQLQLGDPTIGVNHVHLVHEQDDTDLLVGGLFQSRQQLREIAAKVPVAVLLNALSCENQRRQFG